MIARPISMMPITSMKKIGATMANSTAATPPRRRCAASAAMTFGYVESSARFMVKHPWKRGAHSGDSCEPHFTNTTGEYT